MVSMSQSARCHIESLPGSGKSQWLAAMQTSDIATAASESLPSSEISSPPPMSPAKRRMAMKRMRKFTVAEMLVVRASDSWPQRMTKTKNQLKARLSTSASMLTIIGSQRLSTA